MWNISSISNIRVFDKGEFKPIRVMLPSRIAMNRQNLGECRKNSSSIFTLSNGSENLFGELSVGLSFK